MPPLIRTTAAGTPPGVAMVQISDDRLGAEWLPLDDDADALFTESSIDDTSILSGTEDPALTHLMARLRERAAHPLLASNEQEIARALTAEIDSVCQTQKASERVIANLKSLLVDAQMAGVEASE